MNELVELIKRIGIFMIAGQAVLHFAPGQKYEKYIKLIIGTLILLQFVTPLDGILSGAGEDWSGRLMEMDTLFEENDLTEKMGNAPAAADAMVESLENEIKSRLNREISEEGYTVANVQVHMKPFEEDGNRQYELEKVRIVVYRNVPGARADDLFVGKVQIDKIEISLDGGEGPKEVSEDGEKQEDAAEREEKRLFQGEEEKLAERLRERFARVLGLEEEIMEVSVYGADEKTDR